MYQRARKLAVLIEQHHAFRDLAEQQLEAYIIAMEALALVDRKNAWIVIPVTAETEHEVRGPLFVRFPVELSLIGTFIAPQKKEAMQAHTRR